MLSTFCAFRVTSGTKKKTKSFNLTPIHFVVKFHKSLIMNKLFVCIIMPENNNKTILSFLFLQTHCFLKAFFIKKTSMLL